MNSEIILGENLEVMGDLEDQCIDLIYIDPPFNTGKILKLDSIKLGSGKLTRAGFGGRSYNYETVSTNQYSDDLSEDDYLLFLYTRLLEIHRILKNTGSLYLHLDYHSVHYAKIILDKIFGAENFLNEIIWAYDYGGRPKDRWPKKHDNILWYSKSGDWIFNHDDIDRIPYMAPGLVGPEKAAKGKLPTDTWWLTIVSPTGKEKTGYPTQKPVKLLERIVTASSNPGDMVADFFCGSGTTGVAAKNLGRNYLLVDSNPNAIEIAKRRLGKS